MNEYETIEGGGYGGLGGEGGGGPSSSTSSGAGAIGGMGGMGGMGGGTGVCDFSHLNTCQTATQLGNVAGDKNEPPVVVTGTTSEWLVIQIKEKDSNIFEEDLSYTVTLESPAATAYDLFVLQGPQDGSPDCNAAPRTTTYVNGAQVVSSSWDDDQGFGGEDDSLFLCIEVRHASGNDCTTPWTLTIQGHT